jgi:hypothetical protein
MRKMLSMSLIACMVALLSTLLMPAVHAMPPIDASGTWTYKVTIIDTRSVDGYTFIRATEEAFWTGTFVGTSHDVFTVVIYPSGVWYAAGLVFFDGTVNGKSGTLVMFFAGKLTTQWSGLLMILSGTGDLANLRGKGIFWGPSYNLLYSGQIHFERD